MNDIEFTKLINKINLEFPVRLALAEILGIKINPKNYKQLMDFDFSLRELHILIIQEKPEQIQKSIQLLTKLYKK